MDDHIVSADDTIVLNDTNVGLVTLTTDQLHHAKNEMSATMVSENAVLVETSRGLLLSVTDSVGGNVTYGNVITTSADPTGTTRHILPISATLLSHCSRDAIVDIQTGTVYEQHVLDSVDDGCTQELQLTATMNVEPKKRKGGWPKGKKRKSPPELSAPKAPSTGYVLYAIERRLEIKETNPEIPFSEVTKILGQEWSAMNLDKKQKYLNDAIADKKRYIDELKAFQQSDTYQTFLKKKKLKGLCSVDANSLDNTDSYGSLIDLEEDYISELYCRVCNQYFSSLHNKKEHMFGKQHLQAITGEVEKEIQRQSESQQLGCRLFTSDLNADSMASLSDHSELPDSPRGTGPVDINRFIQEFFIKNIEREQECRLLERRLKIVEENNLALFKHAEELKEYEDKLEQDLSTIKAFGSALSAQVDGLKMVPTLFGVINF